MFIFFLIGYFYIDDCFMFHTVRLSKFKPYSGTFIVFFFSLSIMYSVIIILRFQNLLYKLLVKKTYKIKVECTNNIRYVYI